MSHSTGWLAGVITRVSGYQRAGVLEISIRNENSAGNDSVPPVQLLVVLCIALPHSDWLSLASWLLIGGYGGCRVSVLKHVSS